MKEEELKLEDEPGFVEEVMTPLSYCTTCGSFGNQETGLATQQGRNNQMSLIVVHCKHCDSAVLPVS